MGESPFPASPFPASPFAASAPPDSEPLFESSIVQSALAIIDSQSECLVARVRGAASSNRTSKATVSPSPAHHRKESTMTQGNQLPWTDDQWAVIQQAAQRGAVQSRVASTFLPLTGPFAERESTVPAHSLKHGSRSDHSSSQRLEVDDGDTLRLTTLAVELHLTSAQVEDPELTVARQMVTRAADVIGRVEDAIVFNGQPTAGVGPTWGEPEGTQRSVQPNIYAVGGGQRNAGLLGADTVECGFDGDSLVTATVTAMTTLESRGHYGPFAVVLGSQLYLAASSPHSATHVLPSERLQPFLDRPLLRSVSMPSNRGVVVSLSNGAIDLVVAKDIGVAFLQVTLEPRWVLRVSERFVLRVKEAGSAITLVGVPPTPSQA